MCEVYALIENKGRRIVETLCKSQIDPNVHQKENDQKVKDMTEVWNFNISRGKFDNF